MKSATPVSPARDARPARIGVFDSGVGGLSVLRALKARLPHADFLYVADSAHAPYGERSDDYIRARTLRIAEHLLAQGATLLVLACNTATAMAAAAMRERWPDVPLVAVEPGLKPAVAASRNRRIGVMATPATLRSDKFQKLVQANGGDATITLQPCPGLAGQIETHDVEDPALGRLIDANVEPLREAGVDTVVLGCTHYPFVVERIAAAFGPGVNLIDTADAVARQAERLLGPQGATPSVAPVRLQTTGDPERLARFAHRWLPFATDVSAAPAAL